MNKKNITVIKTTTEYLYQKALVSASESLKRSENEILGLLRFGGVDSPNTKTIYSCLVIQQDLRERINLIKLLNESDLSH